MALIEAQNQAKRLHKANPTTTSKKRWAQLHKDATEALQKDEEKHLESKLADLEKAASKREYGSLWQIVNQISGPARQPAKVRKLDGTLPTNNDDIIKEWRTYFETLLNNKSSRTSPTNNPPPSQPLLEITSSSIAQHETVRAIKALKNNKAPEPDYMITAETLKNGDKFLMNQVHTICALVYDQ